MWRRSPLSESHQRSKCVIVLPCLAAGTSVVQPLQFGFGGSLSPRSVCLTSMKERLSTLCARCLLHTHTLRPPQWHLRVCAVMHATTPGRDPRSVST